MDTHLYEVEFPRREIAALAANVTEELMYTQCDVDGNDYLLLPKMVKEAVAMKVKNGNTLWQDTIWKEMKNVNITFQTIPEGEKPQKYVKCHKVFDMNQRITIEERHA